MNDAREDKLGTLFWRASFECRRCLIPMSAWAEADGLRGQKTRTWYSLAGEDLVAVAGVWRPTQEWGNAYPCIPRCVRSGKIPTHNSWTGIRAPTGCNKPSCHPRLDQPWTVSTRSSIATNSAILRARVSAFLTAPIRTVVDRVAVGSGQRGEERLRLGVRRQRRGQVLGDAGRARRGVSRRPAPVGHGALHFRKPAWMHAPRRDQLFGAGAIDLGPLAPGISMRAACQGDMKYEVDTVADTVERPP